jgi:hypothetical protein
MWWLKRLYCKHLHTIHNFDIVHGEKVHYTLCVDCHRTWPIPEVLTRASGVFARIDERVHNQLHFQKQAETEFIERSEHRA